MAIKDILVHVDDRRPSAARMEAAINLATAFDARLIGAHVVRKPYLPAYMEVQIPRHILDAQEDELEKHAAAVEATFTAATDSAGIKSEWRLMRGDPVGQLSEYARNCDLTVIGQENPEDHVIMGDTGFPDRFVLSAGVPVLVVPHVGKYATIGRNVMVAWDGRPVAARALRDAMPFLAAADKVTVMVVNPETQTAGIGDLPGADIAANLARHGVNAEADHVQSDLDPGNMLLSRAADLGIDLLVMGAYGHARWAELVLGGVTDHMMKHMTVPVLMSH